MLECKRSGAEKEFAHEILLLVGCDVVLFFDGFGVRPTGAGQIESWAARSRHTVLQAKALSADLEHCRESS